jgi:DNA polymerase
MAWDERQAAMLAEMGIRLWSRPAPEAGEAPARAVASEGDGPLGASAALAADASDTAAAALDPGGTDRPAGGAAAGGEVVARGRPPGPPPAAPRGVDPRGEPEPTGPGDALAPEGATSAGLSAAALPAAGPERAAAIARLEWPALAEAVARCGACSLCRGRTRTVFGVGHPQAELMVVGEAPGEQEDRQGEPFVGKAGQLLDAMLRAIGRARSPAAGEAGEGDPARRVYIANVLKCRPPQNRNPAPDEVALCEPFLRRQMALVRPRVVLALGRYAVGSLLGSDAPIGRLRGRVHDAGGVPTVVSYHPAYLLRNPSDKSRAWDDLCLVLELLRRAPASAPPKRGSDRTEAGA